MQKTIWICFISFYITIILQIFTSRKKRSVRPTWTPMSKVGVQARGGVIFFPGRGVRTGFLKCGACELIFVSEKGGLWTENFQIGGLWTENFQIWGLVSWKFQNLGAKLWAKIWVKIKAVEAKISKFSQKWVLWADSFAWNGTLPNYRRGVKRGSSGPHIPIPPF